MAKGSDYRYTYERYKTDKEKREERIRMGILPPILTLEATQAIQRAVDAQDKESLKYAKKLARQVNIRAAEIARLVKLLRAMQQEEERRYWLRLAEDDLTALRRAINVVREQRNREAVMVLLALDN